ncbi:hypothetical protein JR316_0001771 [Psilocybe cubensis]|uniref:Uncharacterized protein n=2 Tax=Psilocybe cubensis TaxID=181762 RepID=A0A8H7Y6K4_PSICU|nr:hypothetical protein JR316_0001771 [Psilocybe cubensis]KAH9484869.1 hypothetical protein JR316_0001771 [Psilocybe cubensis]
MSEPPIIVVDDTDTNLITYTGSWASTNTTEFDLLGHSGRPFEGTLHRTSSNASLTFTFNGTFVAFYGTLNESSPLPTPGVPSVQCIILLKNIFITTGFSEVGNNQQFCILDRPLDDEEHTIIVNIIYPINNDHNSYPHSFWFDMIQYRALTPTQVNNSRALIPPPDPRMRFGPGWTPSFNGPIQFNSGGNRTNVKNSTFTMQFIGTSLSWFGYMDQSITTEATTASYAIDDETPTIFNINASNPALKILDTNVLFFQTPKFAYGHHTLTVIYNGDVEDNSTPLTLNYVVIQNSSSSSTVPSLDSPSTSSTSPNSSNSRKDLAPIIGGTLGSLAFIVASVVILILRRRKISSSKASYISNIDGSICDDVPPPPSPFLVTTDDITGSKELNDSSSARAAPETELSPTPTVIGNTQQPRKARTRYTYNPSVITTELGEDSREATRAIHVETLAQSKTEDDIPPMLQRPTLSPSRSTVQRTSFDEPQHNSPASRIVLRDEDSGIRLSHSTGGDIVLLPPEYTLS